MSVAAAASAGAKMTMITARREMVMASSRLLVNVWIPRVRALASGRQVLEPLLDIRRRIPVSIRNLVFLAGRQVMRHPVQVLARSEEHTSELQSRVDISYAV